MGSNRYFIKEPQRLLNILVPDIPPDEVEDIGSTVAPRTAYFSLEFLILTNLRLPLMRIFLANALRDIISPSF